MPKFKVVITKKHEYIVECESMDSAEDIALEMDEDKDNDLAWILDPADEITVEELSPI